MSPTPSLRLQASDFDGSPLPAEAHFLNHGTTLVINSLIQRRGAKTALVTTQGWVFLNLGSLLPLLLVGIGLIWLAMRQRAEPVRV